MGAAHFGRLFLLFGKRGITRAAHIELRDKTRNRCILQNKE